MKERALRNVLEIMMFPKINQRNKEQSVYRLYIKIWKFRLAYRKIR